MNQSAPILEVRNLTVEYRSMDRLSRVVDDVTFAVMPGQSVGLIGDSGSGKSTIIKSILGLLPQIAHTSGEIFFKGAPILGRQRTRAFRRLLLEEIGLVPQAAMNALDPVLRIDRQFYLAVREHRRISKRDARSLAESALERVGISGSHASSYPHQLSGGMRQRVLIALGSVLEPSLLIADEPTTGLDVIVQDKILEAMRQAKVTLDNTLVFVTHDLEVAAHVCDRIIRLERGAIVVDGTPADLDLDQHWTGDGTAVPAADAAPALTVSGLHVGYSQGRGLTALRARSMKPVLEDVNIAVRPGEVLGLAGESGCGKSTLSAAIAGLVDVSNGSITITTRDDNQVILDASSIRAARAHLQMIFQDPYDSLNPRSTVWQTVAEPLLAQDLGGEDGPLGAPLQDLVEDALRAAELDPEKYSARYPASLSGGERQRVAIARALVVRPTVLVADEPVSMLDDATAKSIVTLLRTLARERRVAILLVTHSTILLRDFCDRVAVMYLGRIVEEGPGSKVFTHPRHPYTRALVDAAPGAAGLSRDRRETLDQPSSMMSKPNGCAFHPRCPISTAQCDQSAPVLSSDGVACFHPLAENGVVTLSPKMRRPAV